MKNIKHLLVILASFLLVTASAQATVVPFSATFTTLVIAGISRDAIQIVPQQGQSYSLQTSSDGVNWGPVSGWASGLTIDGKITFVKLDSAQTGYYRVITTQSQIQYNSTNTLVLTRANVEIVEGGRRVTIVGPANLAYTVETSEDLVNWTASLIGVTSQLIFTDSSQVPYRFYRVRVNSG